MRLWGAATGVGQLPVLEALADAGYDGVAIPLAGQNGSELKLLGVAAGDLGLDVSATVVLPATANPISADAGRRARALDYLKLRLDDAVRLGSSLLAGGIYQAQGVFSGRRATDQEWDWCRRFLREAGEYGAQRGISLGLEFKSRYDSYLINTAADAARMCSDVGLANVGVIYNTFHAHLEESNPALALPAAGDSLMQVCLSDSHRGTLGEGQVRWQETLATLNFLDYQGWLIIQGQGRNSVRPAGAGDIWRDNIDSEEQFYRDAITFVRSLLRSQQQ
jgi:D-psicose/D-tagatose/L-ribulose 3-epimerase